MPFQPDIGRIYKSNMKREHHGGPWGADIACPVCRVYYSIERKEKMAILDRYTAGIRGGHQKRPAESSPHRSACTAGDMARHLSDRAKKEGNMKLGSKRMILCGLGLTLAALLGVALAG